MQVKARAETAHIAKAAGLVSAMTLVSRLLGLVREQVFAALLGRRLPLGRLPDRLPHPEPAAGPVRRGRALRGLRAHLRARPQGRRAGGRLPAREPRADASWAWPWASWSLLGILLAWPLVAGIAPGFDDAPGKAELTVRLTRVMMPFLPLVSFAAVAMGMLNAEGRFGIPALSPALFNVVAIVWAGALWGMGLSVEQVVLGWAFGTLAGGLAQFLVQLPSLRRLGWRFRPDWAPGDPGLRQMGRLMAPATVGLAAVQVNIFVSSIFASQQPGAVSWLDYAFRLLYLPIGLFGVALGTIATAGLARRAAEGDMEGLRTTLRQSLSMLAYLTLPATVGLMVLGVPVVRLLYERGTFTAADTQATATALFLYSFGLVGYTGVKVLAPAFYALGTPRVPLAASVAGRGHEPRR